MLLGLNKTLWLWCNKVGPSSHIPEDAYYSSYKPGKWGDRKEWVDGLPAIEALSAMPDFEFIAPPGAGAATEKLRNELQAVRTPSPKLFPSEEIILSTLEATESLLTRIGETKKILRTHAIKCFSMDDMF
jgi:hypothetical protein